jgi:hypothetical protein
VGGPESLADESEPEHNIRSTSQHTRKKSVTFSLHNKSGAAPRPGRSRLGAWDEGFTGEYQEVPLAAQNREPWVDTWDKALAEEYQEAPWVALGGEPRAVRSHHQWEVPQSALDGEHHQQEDFPDDCWIFPEAGSNRRPCQKKGSRPLKHYSVISNHTPNTQKALKTSNEIFRQVIAAQVTFPTDEELEKLSKKCFNKGLASFRGMNGNAPGKYSLVNATAAFHLHHIAQ